MTSPRFSLWMLCLLLGWAPGPEPAATVRAGEDPPSKPSAAGQSSRRDGTSRDALMHGGLKRTYRLYVPSSWNKAKPAPLLIALHGGGGTGKGMERLTRGGFNRLADKEGFLVAYPDGVERHWNDGRKAVSYRTHKEKIDDVGFISALLDRLVKERNIDPRRVYVTGASNGAMMSYRLAFELSGKLAAIAPVMCPMQKEYARAVPPRKIPVLLIQGTADPLAPYRGGRLGGRFAAFKTLGEVLSFERTVAFWVQHNNASPEAAPVTLPDADPDDGTRVRKKIHAARKGDKGGGVEVISYVVQGGGHTWPGGWPYLPERLIGKTCRDFDANAVIWEFFKKHALPKDAGKAAPAKAAQKKSSLDRPGPLEVKVLEFRNLKDAKRNNRSVPVKVLYPDAPGPFPLAIFSHGGAGTWDAFLYQAKHLASHGYVALCVEHVFSNNVKAKEYLRKAKGTFKERFNEMLQRITTDPKSVLERPRDVSFAIDAAIQWNKTDPKLKGRIKTDKIAVIGHSYGAYTALAVCGARPILDYLAPPVKPGKGLAGDLSDPRVTVGVAMSPQGTGTSRFGKDSYKSINRPMLCFSGTKDLQWGHDGQVQPAGRRIEAFNLMPPGGKYLLWLKNADHLAFADNPKAHLLPSKARPDAQRIVKAVTLLFCDAYLKESARAKERLNKQYANSLCGKLVPKVTWFEK